MIKINRNSNFHITFDNGVTVSILIAGGSYSNNHDAEIGEEQKQKSIISSNAEITVWTKGNKWITGELTGKGNDVEGWVEPNDILNILNKAAFYIDK